MNLVLKNKQQQGTPRGDERTAQGTGGSPEGSCKHSPTWGVTGCSCSTGTHFFKCELSI